MDGPPCGPPALSVANPPVSDSARVAPDECGSTARRHRLPRERRHASKTRICAPCLECLAGHVGTGRALGHHALGEQLVRAVPARPLRWREPHRSLGCRDIHPEDRSTKRPRATVRCWRASRLTRGRVSNCGSHGPLGSGSSSMAVSSSTRQTAGRSGWWCVPREVGARKQAEEALRAQRVPLSQRRLAWRRATSSNIASCRTAAFASSG